MMQVQQYQTPSTGMLPQGMGQTGTLQPYGTDPRIHIPTGPSPNQPPPSLFALFLQEILKRKTLLVIWGVLTLIIAFLVITKYAKPLYRAEGKMAYIPNYRSGMKPLYNPPNIQTMGQILKTMDGAEAVRQKYVPQMSKDEFNKAMRFEVSKLSEFLDSSFDAHDPEIATKVANALMEEGIVGFGKYRQSVLLERTKEVRTDYERAANDLKLAKEKFQKAQQQKGLIDVKAEIEKYRSNILAEEKTLSDIKLSELKLKTEIDILRIRRDQPVKGDQRMVDDQYLTVIQPLINELNLQLQNVQVYESAKFRLEQLRQEEERTRELARKGILPINEYQRIVADLKSTEAIVQQHAKVKASIGELQDRIGELKKELASGKPLRLTTNTEIDRAEKELATLPAQVKSYEESLTTKRAKLTQLMELQQELSPLEEEITLVRNRMTDLSAQLAEAQRGKDSNADDLKISTPATIGSGPYTTNGPKMAAAIFAVSGLLFGAYLAIFAIPKAMAASTPATVAAPQPQPPPRAVLAMVPVATQPMPVAPAPTAPPPTTVTQTHHTTNLPTAPASTNPSVVPGIIDTNSTKPKLPITHDDSANRPSVSVATDHEIIIPLEVPTPTTTSAKPTTKPATKPNVAPLPRASLVLKDLLSTNPSTTTANSSATASTTPSVESIKLPPPPKAEPLKVTTQPKAEPKRKPDVQPEPEPIAQTPVEDPGILQLANRITQEGVDRGSIVLFAPTAEQLQLSHIIGDLGRHLSQQGNRVLVFDARQTAENPSWAGTQAPNVGKRVEGFLDGRSEATQFFVPTAMKNVEYSRADLATHVSGVMSAHRFRQLVEEMRERYSLVLMVAPTMVLDGNDPLLAPLAEGLVVVAENTIMPSQIQAYINNLAEQLTAPVYGALTVPKV